MQLTHRNKTILLLAAGAALSGIVPLAVAQLGGSGAESPAVVVDAADAPSTQPSADPVANSGLTPPPPVTDSASSRSVYDPLWPIAPGAAAAVDGADVTNHAADGLLASALRDGGVKTLDDLRFDLRGYVEVGYTYSLHGNEPQQPLFGQTFTDERGNHVQFDQLALIAERVVNRQSSDFEWGGRLDLIYGYDTYRFHANGLDFYAGCTEESDGKDPLAQLDVTQAYVDLLVPVGRGLLLRGGKFVTPIGAETIDPTASPFYSHSYLFGYAKPFTHTGILANYPLDDARRLEVSGGIIRGWDQSLKDNNGAVSFLGELQYRASDRLNMKVGVIVGPEEPECCSCPADNAHYRTLVDGVVRYQANDRVALAAEFLYAYDGAADTNAGSATWYGAAGYASYVMNERVTFNARAEWFFDGDGTRLGTEADLNVYEATIGLTLTPFPGDRLFSNLKIRPEIRFDYADTPEFDGGREHSQVTVGVDATFTF